MTYLSEELQFIRDLHEKASNRAYELGRWAAVEGHTQNPLDLCDSLDKCWADGWQDEKRIWGMEGGDGAQP